MFYFTKRDQPSDFKDYSVNPINYISRNASTSGIDGRATWEHLRNENRVIYQNLQRSLREESHFLCSYCGKRIDGENTSTSQVYQVEHLHPKSFYPSLTLNYNNLLACCYGDDGVSGSRCGQSKKDRKLRINQFSHHFEEKFSLKINGELIPHDDKAREYIDILNLNDSYLKNGRKSALDEYFDSFEDFYDSYDSKLNNREQHFSDFLSNIILVDQCGKRGEYSSFVYFYYRKLIDGL